MDTYPQELKDYAIERMLGPDRASAYAVARETGVGATTVSRWRERARSVARMTEDPSPHGQPRAPKPRRATDWSPEERLGALIEAAGLDDHALGPWLRSRGLHAADIDAWRADAVRGLRGHRGGKPASAEARRVQALERDLARKDKALAEAAALLVLQGKLRALFSAEEGGNTEPR